ncbi:ABC transporter ATP-binding protein [Candidatus Sumerlaeota bacterium]|nr:ABC transporter ATP-binding protein [Candidatus Sumerlaeota bacterium]
MIEVRNLTKTYGDTVAVHGISFRVPEGRILGFLGPNGAGKTTTMRILTGYTPPTRGSASVGGYDVVRQPRQVRRIIGYLPENAPVYGEMTVRGFVGFFAETKGLAGAALRRAVGQALDECGLESVADRLLMNLSKGFRQRAALAQAVVGDPKVLILDEPTVGLDPVQIREIRGLIRGMAERRTVILSTHILPEASLTCSRVVIIARGRVVASGTPENIHSTLQESNRMTLLVRGLPDKVEKVLTEVPHVQKVRREGASRTHEEGMEKPFTPRTIEEYQVRVEKDHDIRAELAAAVVGAGLDLLEMRSVGLSLEDVFVHTITDETEGVRHDG